VSDCLSLRERYFAPGGQAVADPEWLAHLQICPGCQAAFRALPELDRALAELASLPVGVPPFAALAGAAAEAARAQRRRQAVRRSAPFFYTALATLAVAAALAVALWVEGARRRAPLMLAPGAEIRATAEAKTVRLGSGARLYLEAGTLKLLVAERGNETLVLPSGRVSVDVPKLPAGASLSVWTPEAKVRVRGTRFQVMRTERTTQVTVSAGVVEVAPEGGGRPLHTLRAGESLTVPAAELYRDDLRGSAVLALDRGELDAAESKIGQLLQSNPEAAQQAEAQALLAWSLATRGERDKAIALYRRALALLPEGQRPLWAENACAELAILVEEAPSHDGMGIWAECLRRFPNGVHASIARARVRSNSSR
jgi:ferric-dicitrate binding protein FerR (iron transport regulator)